MTLKIGTQVGSAMSKLQKHKIKKNLYLKKKKIQISKNFQNTHNLKNTVNCHKKISIQKSKFKSTDI